MQEDKSKVKKVKYKVRYVLPSVEASDIDRVIKLASEMGILIDRDVARCIYDEYGIHLLLSSNNLVYALDEFADHELLVRVPCPAKKKSNEVR